MASRELKFKNGDVICFTEPLYEQIGHRVLVEAHQPIKLDRINKNHIFLRFPNGIVRSFRYIPERMYLASEAAKVLYV